MMLIQTMKITAFTSVQSIKRGQINQTAKGNNFFARALNLAANCFCAPAQKQNRQYHVLNPEEDGVKRPV